MKELSVGHQGQGRVLREARACNGAGREERSWEQGLGSGGEAALQAAPGSWASEPNLHGAVLSPAARPHRCRRWTGF